MGKMNPNKSLHYSPNFNFANSSFFRYKIEKSILYTHLPPFFIYTPKEREGDLPLYPFSNRGAAAKDQRCPLKYITAPIIFRAGSREQKECLKKKSICSYTYSYVAPYVCSYICSKNKHNSREHQGSREQKECSYVVPTLTPTFALTFAPMFAPASAPKNKYNIEAKQGSKDQ